MHKPNLADPIVVIGRPAESNGATEAAATVTRVWSEREDGSWLVNTIVFPDAGTPVSATSIPLYPTPEAAAAARAENPTSTVAYYPNPF